MPEQPTYVTEELKKFSKNKLPHFFTYAKNKEETQVNGIYEDDNNKNSTVNKLEYIIPNKAIRFKNVAGDCDYKMLMHNPNTHESEQIINRFRELNRAKRILMDGINLSDEGFNQFLRSELLEISQNEVRTVDTLISHLYKTNSKYKDTLWNVYGDIIYRNLVENTKGTVQCDNCTTRFEQRNAKHIYCDCCAKEINREKTRERMKKTR